MAKPVEGVGLDFTDDLRVWYGTVSISQPEDSPYIGMVYNFTITLPVDYPFQRPNVTVDVTKGRIIHPNIDTKGNICLGELQTNWLPRFTIRNVLEQIVNRFMYPDPNNPLEPLIGAMYRENYPKFVQAVFDANNKIRESK